MRFLSVLLTCFLFFVSAVVPGPPVYTISHITLPAEMDKQVCISGMKFLDGQLYFASERCPLVVVVDPSTGAVVRNITTHVPQEFEMEGMTSYMGKIYTVSENSVAVYEIDTRTGVAHQVNTSIPLPPKSKTGDGIEGIAANEVNNKFYLLRERNEDMTQSQLYTFSIEPSGDDNSFSLHYDSMIELPLENPQWRYSDICYDRENDRLLCLKSFSKGKLRKQFIESVDIDKTGKPDASSLKNVPVENFSGISNEYKDQDYSMNLEGITIDDHGNIFVVSDNTNGKAMCDLPSKEKTILLRLNRK